MPRALPARLPFGLVSGLRSPILAALALAACAGSGGHRAAEPLAAPSCPAGWPAALAPADVVIALDTSRSTRNPTGVDIDGDGQVGEFRGSAWTDRDDSVLAAQVEAVRRLLQLARGNNVRFAIVAYSGRKDFVLEDSVTAHVDRHDAAIEAGLTSDLVGLEQQLSRLLRRGSSGYSSFAPPMKLALRVLQHPPDGNRAERGRILFLSDSHEPMRNAPGGHYSWQDRRMRTEAMRAARVGITFDTFAIGPAADAATPHTLTHMAGATGGSFYAVPDPTQIHCSLLTALHEPRRPLVAGGR